jgi:uncharacterized membrane-anchored protein
MAAPAWISRGLVGAGALAVAVVTGHAIWSAEAALRSGTRAYVELRPADPRSLMQGDYMALDFRIRPTGQNVGTPEPGRKYWALASLDGRGVVTVDAITTERPRTADKQIALRINVRGGRWSIGPNAWFFREGTANRWTGACFGEFRIGADGTATLVALTNADLRPL